ncbi:MAG: ATP--cob(I)alamin adenosyltransferase [Clostridiales bacterium]|nr:ATP--cob(I)alamin adenosyltransferase [Clostridiales bacterium]
MSDIYRSKYEAYPFLADKPEDMRSDFEIMTDRICSRIGLLRAICSEERFRDELLKVGELVYHCNPTLRTRMTVTNEEIAWLAALAGKYREEMKERFDRFVLPQGSERACIAHILRSEGKELTRLLYRYAYSGKDVDNGLVDFCNLLSNYFFALSLKFNELDGVEEVPFISRNY